MIHGEVSSPMTLMHFLDSVYVCYAAKSSEMCTNSLSVMGRKAAVIFVLKRMVTNSSVTLLSDSMIDEAFSHQSTIVHPDLSAF